MSIELVRINDYNIEQVLIVDDNVVQDKMQQSVISMTAPANVKVKVFGVDSFIGIYKKNPIKRRTMIVLTNSIDAYRLLAGGVQIDYLNVGGMRFLDGRTKIARAVSVTPEEREAFKKIIEMGIDVRIQMIPRDEIVEMKNVIDNTDGGGK